MAKADIDGLAQRLHRRGGRLTPQRRAVLEVVSAATSRLSPAEVHARARTIEPHLGLATVYRTLYLLAELGLVRRVHMDDHCEAFAATSLPHGHHVICRACGSVEEFAGCDISPVLRSAANQTGYRIDDHWLELVGTCDDCVAAQHRHSRREVEREPSQRGADPCREEAGSLPGRTRSSSHLVAGRRSARAGA